MSTAMKWGLFAVKAMVATLAVLILLCEQEAGVFALIAVKGGALLAIYLLYKDYLRCGRRNLLPPPMMKDYRDIAQSEDYE